MGVAWIYAQRAEAAEEAARMLAELGFSPRRVAVNGSMRPSGEDGFVDRRPDLALVLDDRGDATPVCVRLREDDELGEVPIVVSVDPDGLVLSPEMLAVHELIVAPFTTAELSARIARARRQVQGVEDEEVVRSERLELNLATYQVTVNGVPVDFTYMEYELLKFLMTHPRRAFSREALLSRVWGYDFYGGARTVDVHVRRVRAKLGSEHATKLKTVRRVGYRWED
ncbi:MAG TPA: response regulator transcription factor [Solirubrobacteraceae bacterium]|jgi:DNA-binding response OmpR family regulator|nr:response regulator transcription factor [Solirubrobacteraceae bacterium]